MVDELPPYLDLCIAVILEKRRAKSPWLDFVWTSVAALPGPLSTPPWTCIADEGEVARFFGGNTEICLYHTETNNYRENLLSTSPSIWIALQPIDGDVPYVLSAATVDPAEGESFTQAGQALVDVVPMPDSLRELVAAFTETYAVRQHTHKRRRDEVTLAMVGVLKSEPSPK